MASGPETGEPRVGSLRGAQVAEVDPARLRAVVVTACLAALAVTAVILFVAAAHRNAQVAALHDDGVPVTVTATGCQGLLGGSGSNPAGYSCRGIFTMKGRRYDVAIPGTDLHAPGTHVTEVADPADPGLVTTLQAARVEQPSATVFVLPSALLAALVALAAVVLRRRSMTTTPSVTAAPLHDPAT